MLGSVMCESHSPCAGITETGNPGERAIPCGGRGVWALQTSGDVNKSHKPWPGAGGR